MRRKRKKIGNIRKMVYDRWHGDHMLEGHVIVYELILSQ